MSAIKQPVVPRPRIEGLSDIVFGLALSIGAIQLVTQTIVHSNLQIEMAVGYFGFNFLIILNVWNRYTSVTSVIPVETSLMVRLNMLLLFLVAIEPYFFNLLTFNGFNPNSALSGDISAYYGLDIGGMNIVLGYFTHIMTQEERKLIPKELTRRFRTNRNLILLTGLIFAISALPIFWNFVGGFPVRVILWFGTVPLMGVARSVGRLDKIPKKES